MSVNHTPRYRYWLQYCDSVSVSRVGEPGTQLISCWLADATIGRLQTTFNTGTFTQPPANHIDSPRQQAHTTDPHRHDGAPSSMPPKTPTTHTATTSRQDL
ncbi:hypothetical protein Pcinc_015321 [Petrolisthes cinctipes]|uniref:Uncharacterized protein n=1 Tax=Petrolisthes cinctipes TaxID=88211 RepID=A0AAE1KN99_PETCI|nr:hypothetical protein Pcinc_015321 [Petrolisthes cinctipes]